MIAGGALSGIGSLFKLGTAISQLIKGKKLQNELDKQGRPQMTTPQAFTENEGFARSNYLDPRFAGQSGMENQAMATNANQLKSIQDTAGSGAGALTAMLAGQNNLNNNLTNIGIQGAQFQQRDLENLTGLLGKKADLQQQQWQFNKWEPYAEKAAQARALSQSGQTNIANSLSDGANLAIGLGQNAQQQKNFDSLLGKGLNPAGGGTNNQNFNWMTPQATQAAAPEMPKQWAVDPVMAQLQQMMNPALFYKPKDKQLF